MSSTAIVIAMDKHEGIVLRFRTMSIPRGAVLAGHVVNGLLQTMFSILLVVGVAVLTGFRPTTSPLEIAGAFGMVAIVSFAFTWLAVPLGLVSNRVETASNLPLPLCCCHSSAAASSRPSRCRGRSAGLPSTSRSPR